MKKIWVLCCSLLSAGIVNAGSIQIVNLTGGPISLAQVVIQSNSAPVGPSLFAMNPSYTIAAGTSPMWSSPSAFITSIGGPPMPGLTATSSFAHDILIQWPRGSCFVPAVYDHGPSSPNMTFTRTCGGATRTASYMLMGPNDDAIVTFS